MIEEVRKLRNHRPFSPYTIVLTDGRRVRITDQYQVSFGGRLMVVYDESTDDFLRLYDVSVSGVFADELQDHRP